MAVKIERDIFIMTFTADANYHAHLEGQETFLDKRTGELEYAVSDRNRLAMEMGDDAVEDMLDSVYCNEHPEWYLEIPSMSHARHHSVLQDFLVSDWSTDQTIIDHATNVYYPRKSIGYWLKNVDDQAAVDAYFAFREVENLRIAENYLRENGVNDFEWA